MERLAVCVNVSNRAVTQFTNYPFNSFAHLGDEVFLGANEEGLYLLGGNMDDSVPIQAEVVTKTTDLRDFRRKRFVRAYLGCRCDGDLTFGVSTEDGAYADFVKAHARVDGAIGGVRVPLDSSIRGRYWTFRITNMDGADFSLDALHLINTERRQFPIMLGSMGLHAKLDPTRITYDPELGLMSLARAVNVEIDNTGGIHRRKGYSPISVGEYHSLFCDKGHCLVVREHTNAAAIYRVNPDLTLSGVRSGLTKGRHMAFHAVNGLVYYSNGVENGIYVEEAEASVPWTKADQVGLSMDREIGDPPPACHITTLGLHMILADANNRSVLWVSSDGGFNSFNLDDGHVDLSHPVTMLRGVSDGLWVGTTKETVYLAGTTPDEWVVARRLPYGVKEFSAAHEKVSVSRIGVEEYQGEGIFWVSDRGVCWGGPRGQTFEIAHQHIDPREFVGNAGACLVAEDKLIFTIEP